MKKFMVVIPRNNILVEAKRLSTIVGTMGNLKFSYLRKETK